MKEKKNLNQKLKEHTQDVVVKTPAPRDIKDKFVERLKPSNSPSSSEQ